MKKIFTLICMAFVAMSVNAQTEEIWKVSQLTFVAGDDGSVLSDMTSATNTTATLKKVETQYALEEGAQPTEEQVRADATAALELLDYTFTGTTTNVTLSGISTPNSGTAAKDIWKLGGADNAKLNSTNLGEECLVDFDNQYIVAGNGNPGLESYEYFFTNRDGDRVGPRYYETFWTIGCGSLPLKGCYFKVNSKTAGTIILGFFLNKNLASNSLIILDGSTKAPLAADKVSISAFRQNCNYEVEKGSATKLGVYTLNENYLVQNEVMGSDTNRPLYGYLSFDMAANTDYYMFSPKSQMGVYGFYFAPGGGTGISNVKAELDTDAPVYNLAGQKVSKDYKGVVIQNGHKMINK
ncbi:MAG: hypothetical protein II886_00380 [Prevotella sp.]|nr:hypothetical protein [Prevotella sp.]